MPLPYAQHSGSSDGTTTPDFQNASNLQRNSLESIATAPQPIVGGPSKRVFDIAFALLSLFFVLPLFLIVAATIKLSDGGRVFYTHRRIGQNGVDFGCLKFRTMEINADDIPREYLAQDSERQREWQQNQKLKNDPRITRFGRILRKLSIDELPQLLNVLKGEMSLVGPRPIVAEEVPKYGQWFSYYRHTRPGLTGLWQVSGRNDLCYDTRVKLDIAYIENWSFREDLKILAKTLPAVLNRKGCY